MTHYYLFIQAGSTIGTDSVFYKVGVGTGRQANRDYLFLLAHAISCGYYFEKWSLQVADFFAQIEQYMESEGLPCELRLVKARDLVRALKANITIPLQANALSNEHHMRHYLNANYFLSNRMA